MFFSLGQRLLLPIERDSRRAVDARPRDEWRAAKERGYSTKFTFGFAPFGLDSHTRRTHAQPAEHRARPAARPAHRNHRYLGLGQELARLRHAVRAGAAALRRIPLSVCTPVSRADGEARRR